ncbi:caspase family protein [Streptomyces sp. WM6372]|uniref:caspase family protein n=1 Tax=Streptomyces sp. WM6372 TaxID=1415555 RepID=UPI0006AFFD09|nr:caspase family protein [Streptomyces sp. WM6372]
MVVLPDPASSRCLLVGVSAYNKDGMDDLAAVANNLEQLRAVLMDPEVWGLPEEHCVILRPLVGQEVLDRIRSLTEETEDTFVLYYAGHGLIDPEHIDHLYLAMPDSSMDKLYWSLFYGDVVKALKNSRSGAQRNIVILDCCYSGAASNGGMGGKRPPEEPPVEGIFLLTATARNERARAPEGQPLTDFTAELLSVLSEGVAEGPRFLDLDTLHRQLHRRMHRRNRTHPQLRSWGSPAQLALAHNRQYREPPPGSTAPERTAVPTGSRARKLIGALAAAVTVFAAVTVLVLDPFTGEGSKDGGHSASPPAVESLLRAAGNSFTGDVDLSEEGRIDWVQWGYLPKDRGATAEYTGGPAESECRPLNVYCVTRRADAFVIGDFTALGTEPPVRLHASRQPVSFSWTGGAAPHESASGVRSVVYQGGPGAGFRILVPTKSTTRVFRLYVSYRQGAIRFSASLRNGGPPAYSDTADTASGPLNENYFRVYEMTFRTPEPSLLDVEITLESNHGGGNVTLMAATLQ